MGTLWNVTKGVIFVTGAYVWIKAIVESIHEYNEEKNQPLVQPVMLQYKK